MDMIHSWLEILGAVGGTGAGLWMLVKNTMLKDAVNDTRIVATESECTVIEMLRGEVKRMSESNAKLGAALQEFQLENLELRKEISELHDTINQLSERLNCMQRRSDLPQQPQTENINVT